MESTPQNKGVEFRLTNLHAQTIVAIIARKCIQPVKDYVIDGDLARISNIGAWT